MIPFFCFDNTDLFTSTYLLLHTDLDLAHVYEEALLQIPMFVCAQYILIDWTGLDSTMCSTLRIV
jgi:hypothetical protein